MEGEKVQWFWGDGAVRQSELGAGLRAGRAIASIWIS